MKDARLFDGTLKKAVALSAAACCLAVFAGTSRACETGDSKAISDFLLGGSGGQFFPGIEKALRPLLQDDWGSEPAAPSPDGAEKSGGTGPGSDGEESWGSDFRERRPPPLPPEHDESGGEEQGRRIDATAWRVGIEIGALVPFGAKEDAFSPGRIQGVFLGFGLARVPGFVTLTSEIRLLEGSSKSTGQDGGYDVYSDLLFLRYDFQLQFFPKNTGFAIHFFLGPGLGLEFTTSERVDPLDGSLDRRSGTKAGLLIDAGFAGWVKLGGVFDVVFRIELDFVPLSKNVSMFMMAEAGLQVRF